MAYGSEREAPRDRWFWAYVSAGTVLVLAALIAGILFVPSMVYPNLTADQLPREGMSVKERLDAQNARYQLQAGLRQTLVQAVGSLLAISGAVLAWRQYLKQRQDRRDDTHAKLFGEALAGLGAEALETKVGALYLLTRLAELSRDHRPACADIMLAFVREHRPWVTKEAMPPDVQTALSLLAKRPATWYDLESFPLEDLDLRKADLTGAHLEGAKLIETHLEGARLNGARLCGADLTKAHLMDSQLRRADLSGATLVKTEMGGAEVTGWVLTGAKYEAVGWPDGFDDAQAEAAGAGRAPTATPLAQHAEYAPSSRKGV